MLRQPRCSVFQLIASFPALFFCFGPEWPMCWVFFPALHCCSLCPGCAGGTLCQMVLQPDSQNPYFKAITDKKKEKSSIVRKYFQILGHRPQKLLMWHPDLGGEAVTRHAPALGLVSGTAIQGQVAPPLWTSVSPVLVGSHDAYLTGL